MTDRSDQSDMICDSAVGSNPSKAARQPISGSQKGVFEPLKSGVFEPDFDPLEFERFSTILNPQSKPRFNPYPDIYFLEGEKESKQESTPVLGFENGELCKSGVIS